MTAKMCSFYCITVISCVSVHGGDFAEGRLDLNLEDASGCRARRAPAGAQLVGALRAPRRGIDPSEGEWYLGMNFITLSTRDFSPNALAFGSRFYASGVCD